MRARGIALSMEIDLFLRDVRSSEHRMRVDVANAIEFNIQPSIKLPTHPRSYSGCAKSSIIPEDIKDIDKHARNRRRGNVMLYLRTHRIKDVLIWTPTLTLDYVTVNTQIAIRSPTDDSSSRFMSQSRIAVEGRG